MINAVVGDRHALIFIFKAFQVIILTQAVFIIPEIKCLVIRIRLPHLSIDGTVCINVYVHHMYFPGGAGRQDRGPHDRPVILDQGSVPV